MAKFKYCPDIFVEQVRNSTKGCSLNSPSPGRNINPGPLTHEAGSLTVQSRRSVFWEVVTTANTGVRTPKVTGSVRVHACSYSDLGLKSNVWFRHAHQLRLPSSHGSGCKDDTLLGCCAVYSHRSRQSFHRRLLTLSSER
jgi:hypothetical protein